MFEPLPLSEGANFFGGALSMACKTGERMGMMTRALHTGRLPVRLSRNGDATLRAGGARAHLLADFQPHRGSLRAGTRLARGRSRLRGHRFRPGGLYPYPGSPVFGGRLRVTCASIASISWAAPTDRRRSSPPIRLPVARWGWTSRFYR